MSTFYLSGFPNQNRLDTCDQRCNFFPGGVPAQGNPETAIDHFRGKIHSGQCMTAVTFGAGRTGGYADACILQDVDGILGGNTGDGKADDVGRLVCAVDYHAIKFT